MIFTKHMKEQLLAEQLERLYQQQTKLFRVRSWKLRIFHMGLGLYNFINDPLDRDHSAICLALGWKHFELALPVVLPRGWFGFGIGYDLEDSGFYLDALKR